MEEKGNSQERFQEELRKCLEKLKEDLRKSQAKLEKDLKKGQELEEDLRKNQEKLEENFRKNQEKFQEDLRKNQEKLQKEFMRIFQEERRRRSRINENNNAMNNILKQLQVTKIEDINKLNDQNKKCVICLEDFKNDDKSIYLPCFHLFHEKCITDWINMKKGFCPFCRTIINKRYK